jgi:hypothetical protein
LNNIYLVLIQKLHYNIKNKINNKKLKGGDSMINSLNYSQNNKDLNQINLNNNSINDKNSKIINTIDPTYKNYNKLNLSLKIINQRAFIKTNR